MKRPQTRPKLILLLLLVLSTSSVLWAQATWVPTTRNNFFQLDVSAIESQLQAVPKHRSDPTLQAKGKTITLPNGDGTLTDYRIWERSNFHPDLAARYPEIRSFYGIQVDSAQHTLHLSYSPKGLRALLFRPGQRDRLIEPVSRTQPNGLYRMIDVAELQVPAGFSDVCGTQESRIPTLPDTDHTPEKSGDGQLRTFRMALACTAEYTQYHGGTVTGALAAMNEALTHVNATFELETSVRFELVANNDDLIYLDTLNDPYDNWNKDEMIIQNKAVCNSVVGVFNYDIGHVLSTTFGGLATIGGLCNFSTKARAVSGLEEPEGYFFETIFQHEIGHQFGAEHTQNNPCNLNDLTSYEPGSGSTLMAYAYSFICLPNIQEAPDNYFHGSSLEEINDFIISPAIDLCAEPLSINNSPPVAEAGGDYTLPINTPFELTGQGSDPNDDPITYCWEQMDKELIDHPPSPDAGVGPAFRSFPPTPNPTRVFPNLNNLLNSISPVWEVLPTVSRTMNFRLTVRDNHNGRGTSSFDEMQLTFSDQAGPFRLNFPDEADVVWHYQDTETVTWDVANTDQVPISCSTVDIYLSSDGGFTYPTALALGVPNTGSAAITVPNVEGDDFRVKVKASNNIFFDISNHNFSIISGVQPGFTVTASPNEQTLCRDFTDATFNLNTVSIGGYNGSISLSQVQAPVGIGVTTHPAQIQAGQSATIQLTRTGPVNPGIHQVDLQFQSGSVLQMVHLQLDLKTVAGAPILATPGQNQEINHENIGFSWNSVPEATSYTLEVASSPAFGASVLRTESTNQPNYQLDELPVGLLYYWRVRAVNQCGDGMLSNVRNFLTVDPNQPHTINVSTEEFVVIPLKRKTITADYLSANSNCCPDTHIEYTVSNTPHLGKLYLSGTELGVGDGFTQAQVNAGALQYENERETGDDDLFVFTVAAANVTLPPQSFAIDMVDSEIKTLGASQDLCPSESAVYTIDYQIYGAEGEQYPITVTGVPPGLNVSLSQTSINNDGQLSLTLSPNQAPQTSGNYVLTVILTLPHRTLILPLQAHVVSQPEPTKINYPSDGAISVADYQVVVWEPMFDATKYRVEVSETPDFQNVVLVDTVEQVYIFIEDLPENRLYFIRVRSMNPCFTAPPSPPIAFRTPLERCEELSLENVYLQAGQNQTRSLFMPFLGHGKASEVRIKKLDLVHEQAGALSVTLGNNTAETVVLDGSLTCGGDNLLVSLSDDAEQGYATMNDICQPEYAYSIYGSFAPATPFAELAGTDTYGNWSLQIKNPDGPLNGQLRKMDLEICRYTVQDVSLFLLRNQALTVFPRQEEVISDQLLETITFDADDATIYYVLTEVPTYGDLILRESILTVGDQFTQADIREGLLRYRAGSTAGRTDRFAFYATSNLGGWISETSFKINLREVAWHAENYQQTSCLGAFQTTVILDSDQPIPADATYWISGLPSYVEHTFTPINDTLMRATFTGLATLEAGHYTVTAVVNHSDQIFPTEFDLHIQPLPDPVALRWPYNGGKINRGTVRFAWVAAPEAKEYRLQVATHPNFAEHVVFETTTADSTYLSTNLPLGPVYYWRVSATNACDEGPFSTVQNFQLLPSTCETFTADDVPALLDNDSRSAITLPFNAPISHLEIHQLRLTHSDLSDLSGHFIAPDGTSIPLFQKTDAAACDASTMVVNLADAALRDAEALTNTCSTESLFDVQGDFRPVDPFADLYGIIGQGEWQLQLTDENPSENEGKLEGWSLDVCYDSMLTNFELEKNPLYVELYTEELLGPIQLHTSFPTTSSDEVTYVLLQLPEYGSLVLAGDTLLLGDAFTQANIDQGQLTYVHTGAAAYFDGFYFDLRLPNGGWVPREYFAIELLVSAPELTFEFSADDPCLESGSIEIAFTVEGGGAPFYYSLDGENYQEEAAFAGLSPGQHTIYVKYWNGQVATFEVSLLPLSMELSAFNNTYVIHGMGGVPPYRYALDGGPWQSDPAFAITTPGWHGMAIEDALGCYREGFFEVPAVVRGRIEPDGENIPLVRAEEVPSGLLPSGKAAATSSNLLVYPNPGKDIFQVQSSLLTKGAFELLLLDVSGKVRYRERSAAAGLVDRMELDLSRLSTGVYQLILRSDTEVLVERVVIH